MKRFTKNKAISKLTNTRIFAKNRSSELVNFLHNSLGLVYGVGEGSPFFFVDNGQFFRVNVNEFYESDRKELDIDSVLDTEIIDEFSNGDIVVTKAGFILMVTRQEGAKVYADGYYAFDTFFPDAVYSDEVVRKANDSEIAKFKKSLKEANVTIDGDHLKIKKRLIGKRYYSISIVPNLDDKFVIDTHFDLERLCDDIFFEQGNYFTTAEEAKDYIKSILK